MTYRVTFQQHHETYIRDFDTLGEVHGYIADEIADDETNFLEPQDFEVIRIAEYVDVADLMKKEIAA